MLLSCFPVLFQGAQSGILGGGAHGQERAGAAEDVFPEVSVSFSSPLFFVSLFRLWAVVYVCVYIYIFICVCELIQIV